MTDFQMIENGYSHVARVPRDADLVFVSGQVGLRPDGTLAKGVEAQTRQIFANIGRRLEAAGATWADVVKLTYFVTDMSCRDLLRVVRDEYVNTQEPPTSSLMQVSALFRADVLIEIEAIAAVKG